MTGPAERDQVTHHLARKRLGNAPPFLISSAVCCVSRPAEVTWEGIIQGCRPGRSVGCFFTSRRSNDIFLLLHLGCPACVSRRLYGSDVGSAFVVTHSDNLSLRALCQCSKAISTSVAIPSLGLGVFSHFRYLFLLYFSFHFSRQNSIIQLGK